MHAAGLLRGFQTSFTADPFHCLRKIKQEMTNKKRNQNVKKPLSLKGLSGAFLILGVGYGVAIIVFLFEICYGYSSKSRQDFIRCNNNQAKQAKKTCCYTVKNLPRKVGPVGT